VRATSQEDRFQTIFELAPDAYYIMDFEGRFVDGNRLAEELVGYDREELIGRSFLDLDLLPEESKARAAEQLARNARGHATGPETLTLRRRGGELLEVEIRSHPITIDGKPLVVGIARDVTERRKLARQLERLHGDLEVMVAERTAELEASEDRYRAVIEQSMDCIFLADVESGKIHDANKAFRDKLGYTPVEIGSLTLHDVLAHPPESIDRNSRKILGNGSLFLGERHYRHKGGTEIPLEVSVSVVTTRSRKVFCVVSRDITDRKRAEVEKDQIYEQLLQAQKMEAVGVFAGGLAHDFNNMMTAILGRVQLAHMHLDRSHRAYREVEEIEKAAQSAADLTRQLLLFSRNQPTTKKPLSLISVVDGMLGMISRLMGEDVQVSIEGARDIWTVEADRGNVEQLIMNLATNARDAMTDGGSLKIHLWNITLKEGSDGARRSGRTGRFVRISVMDDGAGMDAETRKRIFEPFYTTKSSAKGTGLGLSVVHRIMEQHDGWIEVDSRPGEGSDFRIYFPALPGIEAEEVTGEFIIERYMGSGERVLFVEDDEHVRHSTSMSLQHGKYEVLAVSSAEEALNVIEKHGSQFDLVFTDIIMPGMNGIDLVRLLRREHPGIKVLLTSGYADERTRLEAINKEGLPFLPKPYDVASLLRGVWKALRAK
jgi:PAS domain S-box-containing protein